MKHSDVRWNPARREHFCVSCGRTTDSFDIADAQQRLERFDCVVPSVDAAIPEPGTETIRLMLKSLKPLG
jgi:hypothetical protein